MATRPPRRTRKTGELPSGKTGPRQLELFSLHAGPRKPLPRPTVEARNGYSVTQFEWQGKKHEMAFAREEVSVRGKKMPAWRLSFTDMSVDNPQIYRILIRKAIIAATKNHIHQVRITLDHEEYTQGRTLVETLLKLKFNHSTDSTGARGREDEQHVYTYYLKN